MINSRWLLRRESQFSLRVWSLVGPPYSRRWPHTREYTGSTNWTRWFIILMTTGSSEGKGGGVDPGGVRERNRGQIWSKYIAYMYEILKEQKYHTTNYPTGTMCTKLPKISHQNYYIGQKFQNFNNIILQLCGIQLGKKIKINITVGRSAVGFYHITSIHVM